MLNRFVGLGFGLILLDQISKYLAQAKLSLLYGKPIIGDLLHFHLVHNSGAAYGIFSGKRFFLVSLSSMVVVFCIVFRKKIITSTLSAYGLTFLLSGAIGNLIDRASTGFVVDFINIHIIPVFNVADVCINIGVACFLIELILTKKNA